MASAELRTFTPLGAWFWDALTDRPVGSGLDVRAHPLARPHLQRRAVATRSGVYGFPGLPGLRAVEYPAPGVDVRAPLAPPRPFVVSVRDPLARFVPVVAILHAPALGPAAAPVELSPPGGPAARIYLFSAATRRVLSDVAVVRAQLRASETGAPAAHARLDMLVGGLRWAGVADERGVVAVMFPYPLFAGAALASPPAGVPSVEQTWAATIEVRYQPDALDFPPGCDVPTLTSIVLQEQTMVRPHSSSAPVSELHTQLSFGSELLLVTEGDDLSTLVVGGGSP
jgi:hypothetical protein